MNNFKFETQGTNTYIVYELDKPELLDSMTLGMITNNKIPGLAPAIFMQLDNVKYVKYNISSKVSAEQFLMGTVNKKRLVGVFNGIVNAMMSAEEYMIDPNSLCLDLKYIYTDVSTCETVMICLPITSVESTVVDLKSFFKNIVFSTQFDQTENGDYIAKLINYLNSPSTFSLSDFKEVLDVIEHGAKPVQPQVPVQPVSQAPVQPVSQAPVQPVPQAPVQPVVPQAPVQSVQQVQPQAPVQPVKLATVPQTPVKPATVPQAPKVPTPGTKVPSQNQGMAVPGKGASDANKKSKDTLVPEGEISFMYLMQHYNKDNAAAYKAQQEAKKAAKAAGAPAKEDKKKNKKEKAPKAQKGAAVPPVPGGVPTPANYATPGQTPQPTPVAQPIPQPVQQPVPQAQPVVPQPQAPVQPAPQAAPMSQVYQQPVFQAPPQSSMNFGETTVLSSGNIGETTVLGATPMNMEMQPYLIRTKNNERILLDKPNFRIGKEKSFVDYFIGDNTAISRSHANIITKDGEYFVMDTNSTNHTYVDGQMIQSNVEVKIAHGTKIKLANEDFEFKIY